MKVDVRDKSVGECDRRRSRVLVVLAATRRQRALLFALREGSAHAPCTHFEFFGLRKKLSLDDQDSKKISTR